MGGNDLRLLSSAKKAFQQRKRKLIMLHEVIRQLKPILEEYMAKEGILKLCFNLREKSVLALEPVENCERNMWVQMWLDDEFSSEKLVQKMKYNYQWVHYSVSTFLRAVEQWIENETKLRQAWGLKT